MSEAKYTGDFTTTTDMIVNDVNIDEGCIPDLNEEARGLTTGPPGKYASECLLLTTEGFLSSVKDSGFSSRVSEVDTAEGAGNSILADQNYKRDLTKRLARISECQHDEKCRCSPWSVVKVVVKIVCVFLLLYIFICTLDLLSNAFRLLGGKTAGSVFQDSELLANPITGLMIGVLATVILQSSSTSSSIVITMVASNIIDIRPAIPIIMGANIGTTVTNTLVSLAHSMNRKEFRRAFSGAVVHDVFNWLTVLILLPLEYFTGYLYHLTKAIVSSLSLETMKAKDQDLLMVLTKPLTSRIVEVDKNVITAIAEGKNEYMDKPLLKVYCSFNTTREDTLVNKTVTDNITGSVSWVMSNETVEKVTPGEKCETLMSLIGWNDTASGILLFIASIIMLSLCLYALVKLLHSLLGGHIAKAARKTINADFPRPFHWLTGYAALVVGAGMTILVQSSSVFTSALTPLVGIGCLKLERMYPLTLGSNIGTTFTGILAALAASSSTISVALQLAFCHLFFNISGILLFYPIPKMRLLVINIAKYLGRTTACYRWFAIAYLVFMFLIFPAMFFAVSFAGRIVFVVFICVLSGMITLIVVINVMQRYDCLRKFLPVRLHTWNFLPEFMRSLAPVDRCLNKLLVPFSKCCCQCCINRCSCLRPVPDIDMGCIDSDSDSESSAQSSYLPSAASSRMFLASSSSRIYKPRESASRRNSLTRKSPSVKHIAIPEVISTTTPLLEDSDLKNHQSATYIIPKSELNKSCDSQDKNTVTVDMTALKVESLNESVI
ncbi:unnamed protein product [Candidula unifasciata]|uniref:Sodium-dependent phosphate transport protein 2B n=1 Tax=Candidula unifasciata TaxID=100452 RepID=A0A8S3YVG8_9EUPU|nr:unnamed protein product [Candidula unifasciata]